MPKIDYLEPVFVELMPRPLEPGKLYVSIKYKTTTHLCASGCGNKVVLPLSPAEWKLTYDGEAVSMSPSVGNWEFPCKSHYWIRRGRVDWAPAWEDWKIEAGRQRDEQQLDDHFALRGHKSGESAPGKQRQKRWYDRLFRKN